MGELLDTVPWWGWVLAVMAATMGLLTFTAVLEADDSGQFD